MENHWTCWSNLSKVVSQVAKGSVMCSSFLLMTCVSQMAGGDNVQCKRLATVKPLHFLIRRSSILAAFAILTQCLLSIYVNLQAKRGIIYELPLFKNCYFEPLDKHVCNTVQIMSLIRVVWMRQMSGDYLMAFIYQLCLIHFWKCNALMTCRSCVWHCYKIHIYM